MRNNQGAVILTCAVTGSIHTPSMSPHLPITPGEIASQSVEAARAGAAILHLHVRDPETGRPVQSVDLFQEVIQRITAQCDAVINITTGGAPTMLVDERIAPAVELKPPIASLNMGSMNFGLYPMLSRHHEFRHAWERPYIEGSRDRVFRNTFADIENILTRCGRNGTRFEFECYDIGHLYTLDHFVQRGLIAPPFFVQGVFGLLGGIGAHPRDVEYMHEAAERLFGNDYHFSGLGAGRAQLQVLRQLVERGANARVGMEDSLWIARGEPATSNAQQVLAAREIIHASGRRLASPTEARRMLDTQGADR